MMTLVSNFDHLRDVKRTNWNPIILLKRFEIKMLKTAARLLKKVVFKIQRLRLLLTNPPP
jgi:hypothetical protein